ncbi:unnamed protein product [Acanthoscelides obtectus]|nr:unnamed protein product [Acanthoscelides obtectus]CAK1651399.1 hypothetical protein AOBTE_LOCUS17246 [Acanthoscelides obtectus]
MKEKFETKIAKDSWPTINEEFKFNLILPSKPSDDFLKGTFASFTVYAVMGKEEDEETDQGAKRLPLKRYLSFNDTMDEIMVRTRSSFRKPNSRRRCSQNAVNNRRIIGTVTYNLDKKSFTQRLRSNIVSTPDIWRNVSEITSGFQTQPRDGVKGCVELTLQYGISEDGTNDVVEVSITKFRCSLQTMRQHEKVGGQLYLKITAFEDEDLVQKMKSDKFDPTISLRLEASSSTLRATVNKYNMQHMKIMVRLMSRNLVGKKTLLGKIEIDHKSAFWKEVVSSPSTPITKMVNFE